MIRVEITEPTGTGRLYADYDREDETVRLVSTQKRRWRYDVSVHDVLILRVDESRRLSGAVFLWRRSLWPTERDAEDWGSYIAGQPRVLPAVAGDVVFSEETLLGERFHNVPPRVRASDDRTTLQIVFDTSDADVQPVELSGSCMAFVAAGCLLGFFAHLKV